MKILYDHQVFTWQNFGGISRYHYELIKRLGASAELALKYSDNEYIRTDPAFSQQVAGKPRALNKNKLVRIFLSKKKRGVIPGARQNERLAVASLGAKNFNLFHPTYYDPYFLDALQGRPFVLTVHDMIHELYPEHFHLTDSVSSDKRRLVEKAAHIIAVSETTKRDLVALLGAAEERITVVYHGSSLNSDGPEAELELPEKFLLMVGSRPSYKNTYFALQALRKLLQSTENLAVVFAGGGPFSAGEQRYFATLGLAGKIFHFPGDNDTLRKLYRTAEAFLFPSLYEGFGIPVLEAFSCGCPVLASNTAALREVAGDAALYFDPKSPQEIEAAVKRILAAADLREKLRQAGTERAKQFSWERCAEETIEVYRKAVR